MKKTLTIVILCLVTAVYGGTVTLKVTGTAGLRGTAKVVNELLPDGSKRTRMEMSLRNLKGQSVEIIQESIYESSGIPRYKQQSTTIEGKAETKVVARFSPPIIVLQATTSGKTTETTVLIPNGVSIAEKFEFWFSRDMIGFNGENTFQRFDLVTLTFEKAHAIYRGRKTIRVGKLKVKAHLVEIDDTKIYLDNQGDPYKILSTGVVMERIK